LNDFGKNGCTAEGVNYWNYGFGRYVQFAAALQERTGGEYSLFTPPIVEDIAMFPIRAELSPHQYPTFSDSSLDADLSPYIAVYLGNHFNKRVLLNRGQESLEAHPHPSKWLAENLRTLAWCREDYSDLTPDWTPTRTNYFSDCEWWIARSNPTDEGGLAIAAKGGHNTESHNHNDCGTFIVQWNGEPLITDIGASTYFDGYFGTDRYSYLATRSLGHSVPIINKSEQASGQDKTDRQPTDPLGNAEVIHRKNSTDKASFRLDLAGCYPEAAGVDNVFREITLPFDTPTEKIVVEDDIQYSNRNIENSHESLIISLYAMETNSEDNLIICGEKGELVLEPEDPETELFIDCIEDGIHSKSRGEHLDVWRCRINPSDVGGGRYHIYPSNE
jgi:hypothetical protein